MLLWVGVACFGFIAIIAIQEQLRVKKDREKKLLEIRKKINANEERAKRDKLDRASETQQDSSHQ